ncbi:hypothetical protein EYZ11_006206 [Aspergillus tanneri]|uniref:Aldehyde dehydrogenase domain-containing protein n=1 Tax=Aspergillus tanneri TaxID=1220188 RepID=A0A4S3JGH7_9EURO|nr:hypothetical protein EYZ11_006206 [Aspergillus tanneri]
MADLFVDIVTPNDHRYSQPTGLFINNEFVPSGGQTITSIDPATDKPIATVHAASTGDVDRAVNAAKAALVNPCWKKLPATGRGQMMARLADLIEKNRELFASIDAWDNGMNPPDRPPRRIQLTNQGNPIMSPSTKTSPKPSSKPSSKPSLKQLTISTTPEKFAYTIRQPVGVVGQIIPWNYPLSMATWKLGPVLTCGNTIVLKPAEQTPLSTLVLGNLIKEVGFSPGAVNITNGYGREAGAALASHPLVDKIAFTGSTMTAREIIRMAAGTLKNITLETGGTSPLLVFPDADLDEARDIFQFFLTKFKEAVKTTSKIGDQLDESIFQEPQVTRAQYKRILSYIEMAKSEGATVVTGGSAHTPANSKNEKGYFVEPTVFTDTTDSMRIVREEVFGPVVVILSFSSEEESIQRANSTTYGLGAAVFNLERAHRVAAEIESGKDRSYQYGQQAVMILLLSYETVIE